MISSFLICFGLSYWYKLNACSFWFFICRKYNFMFFQLLYSRESSCGSYKFTRISTWRRRALSGFRGSNLIVIPAPRKIFREHAYLRSLVNVDGTTASEVLFVDQLLLMTSIFLTYMAGVIPVPKSNQPGNIISNTNSASDNPTFSGR